MPDLNEALRLTTSIVGQVMQAVDGRQTSKLDRERLATLYYQIAIEDCDSIAVLVRRRRLASARALIRPLFESFVRGSWVLEIAGEGTVESLMDKSARWPALGSAVEQLEAHKAKRESSVLRFPFGDILARISNTLHDHVHRGHSALGRQHYLNHSADEVQPDELAFLALATNIGLSAGCGLLDSIGSNDAADALAGGAIAEQKQLFELAGFAD